MDQEHIDQITRIDQTMGWHAKKFRVGRSAILLRRPTVVLSAKAAFQIQWLTHEAKGEVSGFGTLEESPDTLYVKQLFLPPQSNSSGDSHIPPGGQHWTIQEAKRLGIPLGTIRFWWHSHGGNKVFASARDVRTQLELTSNRSWLCLITNKRAVGDYNLSSDKFKGPFEKETFTSYIHPPRVGFRWDNLKIYVESQESDWADEVGGLWETVNQEEEKQDGPREQDPEARKVPAERA